jgi:hypothetical protein
MGVHLIAAGMACRLGGGPAGGGRGKNAAATFGGVQWGGADAVGDVQYPDPPKSNHDPDGIRTRVAALKGPCPRPLDDGAAADGRPSALGGGRQYADGRRGVNGNAGGAGTANWKCGGREATEESRSKITIRSKIRERIKSRIRSKSRRGGGGSREDHALRAHHSCHMVRRTCSSSRVNWGVFMRGEDSIWVRSVVRRAASWAGSVARVVASWT